MSRKSLVPIALPADPTNALEATTKQYVDSKAGAGGLWTTDATGIAYPNAITVGGVRIPIPAGTSVARIGGLPGLADWAAMFLNAQYTPSGWILDDTSRYGMFFKLDVRTTTDNFAIYRIPPGGGAHTDETPMVAFDNSTGLGRLIGDPTVPLGIATKQYVDAKSVGSTVNEVFVGPADPGSTFELWYDNDAVPPAAPGTAVAPEVFIGPNDPGVTFALWYDTDAPSVLNTLLVARNILNNGQLAVAQRTTGAITLGAASLIADRWGVTNSGIGTATLSYATTAVFGPTPPVGRPRPAYIQYISVTVAEAAGSLAAADYMQWSQGIEGINLQHLGWGTPGALPVTVSFDCYSSVASTYVCELARNEPTTRTIARTFTVPAGFSTVVLTFPGDTTTLVTNDVGARLNMTLFLGAGPSFTTGPLQTTWGNVVTAARVAGISNNFAATVGNVFAVTNLQLEPGSQATPYEVRSFANELRDCQRYYEVTGYVLNAASPPYYSGFWKVTKRSTPTVTVIPQAGTGAVMQVFPAGQGELTGFYQNSNHSTASNSQVIGNCEI